MITWNVQRLLELIHEADTLMDSFTNHMILLQPDISGCRLYQNICNPNISTISSSTTKDCGEDHTLLDYNPLRSKHEYNELAKLDLQSILKGFIKQAESIMPLSEKAVQIDRLHCLLPQTPSTLHSLQTITAEIYQLINEIYVWKENCWIVMASDFLKVQKLSIPITFSKHRVLSSALLDCLVKYVKLHLLWSSFPLLIGVLLIHAYFQRVNRLNHNWRRQLEAQEYVLSYGTNPLLKIHTDFLQLPHAEQIIKGMINLSLTSFAHYTECRELNNLCNHGIFDLQQALDGYYSGQTIYIDCLYMSKQREWVISVALCTMSHLSQTTGSSKRLRNFLQIILSDVVVMSVFRDFVINVHSLLSEQASSIKGIITTGVCSPSTTFQADITRMSKRTIRNCYQAHKSRLQSIDWSLRNLCLAVKQNDTLIGPKLPMLFALISLGCQELQWIFSHGSLPFGILRPTGVKRRYFSTVDAACYHLDNFTLASCGYRITQLYKLHKVISAHQEDITSYFTNFIINEDAKAISAEMQLAASQCNAREIPATALDNVLVGGNAVRLLNPVTDQITALYIEWQRQRFEVLSNDRDVPSSVYSVLDRGCRHFKYAFQLSDLLYLQYDWRYCWWFSTYLELIGNCSLRSPQHCEAYFNLLEIVEGVKSALKSKDQGQIYNISMYQYLHVSEWIKRMVSHFDVSVCKLLAICIQLKSDNEFSCVSSGDPTNFEPNYHTCNSYASTLGCLQSSISTKSKDCLIATSGPRYTSINSHHNVRIWHEVKAITHCERFPVCAEILLSFVGRYLGNKCSDVASFSYLRDIAAQNAVKIARRQISDYIIFDGQRATLKFPWEDAIQYQKQSIQKIRQFLLQCKFSVLEVRSMIQEILFLDFPVTESEPFILSLMAHTNNCKQNRILTTENFANWALVDRVAYFYATLALNPNISLTCVRDHCRTCIYDCESATNSSQKGSKYSIRHYREKQSGQNYISPTAISSMSQLLGATGMHGVVEELQKVIYHAAKQIFEFVQQDSEELLQISQKLNSEKCVLTKIDQEVQNSIKKLHHLRAFMELGTQLGNLVCILQQFSVVKENLNLSASLVKSNAASLANVRSNVTTAVSDTIHDPSVCNIGQLLATLFACCFYGSTWSRTASESTYQVTNENIYSLSIAMAWLLRSLNYPEYGTPISQVSSNNTPLLTNVKSCIKMLLNLTQGAGSAVPSATLSLVQTFIGELANISQCVDHKSSIGDTSLDEWMPQSMFYC